jgi:TolB-like protein/class 3 adenylate cyclase
VERRLAAVLAADVAGYSRLMGADEEGTLARLKAVRKDLVDPTIASHRGRIVKTTGDGMLVEFASAVDAVRGAVEVQRGMAEQNASVPQAQRIEFRIGIHVGDIIIDENDIFGDGVNIAARLEGMAEPGGICMSDDAYRQIRGKVEIVCDDLGLRTLKNISEPMRAWHVQHGAAKAQPGAAAGHTPALALPDKPSIAVLPFQNMSGDPEQEYFADGIVEDITTSLSRSRMLFVIARNSSFTYKGKAVDIKLVGRELGVRYVVEGSVRKAGKRVRVTAQLIEAATSAHVWADHFDGELEDIFDFQDQVTASVIGAIYPRLERAEIIRAQSKPTGNLQAYDCYLRALAHDYKFTREDNQAVLQCTEMANRLDPSYARPYAFGAMSFVRRKNFGWIIDPVAEATEARRLAARALELDRDDPVILANVGWVQAYLLDKVEEGLPLISKATHLDPNLFSARQSGGWVHLFLGNLEAAAEHFQAALRISPLDPRIFMAQNGMAFVKLLSGQYEEGLSWATTAFHQQPNYLGNRRVLFCSLAMCGRVDEAKQAAAVALREAPTYFNISEIRQRLPLRRNEDVEKLAQAYRLAGLPE